MANLNRYLDELSLIKVLLFFILVILVMTLFGMVFNIEYGDLTFKLILYGFMIVFFAYNFNHVKTKGGETFSTSLNDALQSLFSKNSFFSILFIIVSNILFVAFIFFLLEYMGRTGILNFDSYVIFSPIVEEVLFRGIFLRRFNEEFGNVTLAILVSSVLFALCHSFGGISGAFLFGICMAVLYIKSENILVPIFAHFLNNLISFVLGLSGMEFLLYDNIILIAIVMILAVAFNAYLFKSIIAEWPKRMN